MSISKEKSTAKNLKLSADFPKWLNSLTWENESNSRDTGAINETKNKNNTVFLKNKHPAKIDIVINAICNFRGR